MLQVYTCMCSERIHMCTLGALSSGTNFLGCKYLSRSLMWTIYIIQQKCFNFLFNESYRPKKKYFMALLLFFDLFPLIYDNLLVLCSVCQFLSFMTLETCCVFFVFFVMVDVLYLSIPITCIDISLIFRSPLKPVNRGRPESADMFANIGKVCLLVVMWIRIRSV